MSEYTLALKENPGSEDYEFLNQQLREYNAEKVGYRDARPLAVYVYDEQGQVVGGLFGMTFWGWLAIDLLWLAEAVRGQGYGSQLIELAEQEALKRGCQQALVDTLSFQAPDFYLKHGYQVFGKLSGFAGTHERFYFFKVLQRIG